jgi:hypothetical protein
MSSFIFNVKYELDISYKEVSVEDKLRKKGQQPHLHFSQQIANTGIIYICD